jgi:eukaryotic-like serine/threonine-protein kinase
VPDDTLAPGLLILDRFRLKRVLGSGGMGSVWEASHLALGTEIAIKFLDAELSRRSDIRSRFAQEATAAARIKSAHVVSILDFGFTEGGRGFIVMERLCGEDLGQHLARTYTLSPEELAPIITQACRGLGKAHALGIIHRDIKPENLFLNEEEEGIVIKLLDFGIAKHVDATPSHRTDTGQLLGTPLYMSPEQALGRPLDTRTDLYSLAIVAYRSLAGRPPFVHRATGELIVSISTEVPPPPSLFNPNVPEALDAWFAAMLVKDPEARLCQTAASLAESFSAACQGIAPDTGASLGFSATLPGSSAPTVSEVPGGAARRRERSKVAAGGRATPSPPRGTLRRRVAPAALLLGVAVAGFWLALRQIMHEPPAQLALPAQPGERVPPPPVKVLLGAMPREATLYLDGERLANNPITLSRPGETSARRLRAEAPGFQAAEREVTLDRNDSFELVLSPSLPSPETQAPPTALPPAASSPVTRSSAPGGSAPKETARPRPRPARPPSALPAPADSAPKPSKRPRGIDRSNPWSSQ